MQEFRALDRLEMGTKLKNREGKNLYAFWTPKISASLKRSELVTAFQIFPYCRFGISRQKKPCLNTLIRANNIFHRQLEAAPKEQQFLVNCASKVSAPLL